MKDHVKIIILNKEKHTFYLKLKNGNQEETNGGIYI